MAGPNVIHPPKRSADIKPRRFQLWFQKPQGDGWQAGWYRDSRYEPISMTEADGGEDSTLTLKRHLGSDPQVNGGAQIDVTGESWIPAGTRVKLEDVTREPHVTWFIGYVGQESSMIQSNPDGEHYSLTVYGPEWALAGSAVEGAWYANATTDAKVVRGVSEATDRASNKWHISHLPCVFNKDNLPNMSKETWTLATDGAAAGAVFVPGDRVARVGGTVKTQSQRWTAYKALRSVVEVFDGYNVISPTATSWPAIEKVLGSTAIGEVDVDGMTIPQAIRAILGPLGFGFRLDTQDDGHFRHSLHVYPLKAGNAGKKPYMAPSGTTVTDAQGSASELTRVELLRDSHNIRNAVDVYGQEERVQLTLTYKSGAAKNSLFPAWSITSKPLTDYIEGGVFKYAQLADPTGFRNEYHTSGRNFAVNRDVWRTFVFNEDGGMDLQGWGDSALPDVASLGLGDAYVRRPIGPKLTKSEVTGDYPPATVTMSTTVNGEKFTIDATEWFEILPDRAGIRLKADFFTPPSKKESIDTWCPFHEGLGDQYQASTNLDAVKDLSYLAMLNNALTDPPPGDSELELSVTGSLMSTNVWESSAGKVNTSPLHLPRYRLVRTGGFEKHTIRTGDAGGRDDTAQALAMAKAIRSADDCEAGNASLMCHTLNRTYYPGTVIPQTSGRVIKFQTDGQRKKYAPVVRRVTHHFGETNVTEVLLDSPLLRQT